MKTQPAYALIPALMLLCSCGNDSSVNPSGNSPTGKIFTEEAVEVAHQVIPSSGGTLTVDDPSGTLDGMEIIVPAGAFSEDQEFIIEQAEITSHEWGSDFNPVSPMIRMTCSAEFSDSLITLKIPIDLPEDHFAMGFFYEDATEQLEPVPMLDLDTQSITLTTRQFPASGGSLMKRTFESATIDLIISGIDARLIDTHSPVRTGFSPGQDDWEFPNYGSYITPGGICSGMSISAMWYYKNKKLNGKPDLYHQFDKVHDPRDPRLIWADNPLGYRFASVIQKESYQDTGFIRALQSLEGVKHSLTWRSLIYYMVLFKEPAYIVINRPNSNIGHALIAYEISPQAGTIKVADPNFPGDTGRIIEYWNGTFIPYESPQKDGDPPVQYPYISFLPKFFVRDKSTLENRWTEFENGTIGNDQFPSYELWVKTSAEDEKVDGDITTSSESLKIYCTSGDIPIGVNGINTNQQIIVYDQEGKALDIAETANMGIATIPLEEGLNKLGVYITGALNRNQRSYVDFKWIDVMREEGDESEIDFSKVTHVTFGLFGLETKWLNYREEPKSYFCSPVAGADVQWDGHRLEGTNGITNDYISLVIGGSSAGFHVECRVNLGSPGWRDGTFEGSMSLANPEYDSQRQSFHYRITGPAAVDAAISTLIIESSSMTWEGYEFKDDAYIGLTFEY